MEEVKIGNQTWMSKNLDINDGGEGIYINPENGETYYTWEAAMRVAKSIEGWHLPNNDEWETLFTAVGGTFIAGTKLKSTSGWEDNGNGSDSYGFSALAAGYRYYDGDFYSVGNYALFWSSTEDTSLYAYYWYFIYDDDEVRKEPYYKSNGFSVRLIKD